MIQLYFPMLFPVIINPLLPGLHLRLHASVEGNLLPFPIWTRPRIEEPHARLAGANHT